VSRLGVVVGAHIGASAFSGYVYSQDLRSSVAIPEVAGGGVALGLEAGFRFARHWIVGVEYEHDLYQSGTPDSFTQPTRPTLSPVMGGSTHAHSSLLQVKMALVANPDRVSFYGDVGVGVRWFTYSVYDGNGAFLSGATTDGAEFSLGVGIWIPIGKSFRLLPRVSLDVGTYASPPDSLGTQTDYWHVGVMGGIAGLYNLNF
jgi:hypothetical protein